MAPILEYRTWRQVFSGVLFDMIKSAIQRIDALFFGGMIRTVQRENYVNKSLRPLNANLDHRFIAYYEKNYSNLLSELCDKYGSDKGEIAKSGHPYLWPSHTYADFYSRLYDHCRIDVKRVFECGLGTNNPNLSSSMGISGKPGASLRVWRDYFPNAQVFGADIDRDILFEEERIRTLYVDQTNPKSIGEFWTNVGLSDFDFMIDDGLHVFESGTCLFENSISKLSKRGIYIIEDVSLPDLTKYKSYFDNKKYQVDYVILVGPRNLGLYSNNLVVVRRA